MIAIHAVLATLVVGNPTHPYASSRHSVMPSGMNTAIETARGVPSFSRQTGLACSACHYQFPQLTPFGRLALNCWKSSVHFLDRGLKPKK